MRIYVSIVHLFDAYRSENYYALITKRHFVLLSAIILHDFKVFRRSGYRNINVIFFSCNNKETKETDSVYRRIYRIQNHDQNFAVANEDGNEFEKKSYLLKLKNRTASNNHK